MIPITVYHTSASYTTTPTHYPLILLITTLVIFNPTLLYPTHLWKSLKWIVHAWTRTLEPWPHQMKYQADYCLSMHLENPHLSGQVNGMSRGE